MLLLERRRALLGQPLLLPQPDAVLLRPRALELDELLLTLRGQTRHRPLRLVRLTLDLPRLLGLLDLLRLLGLSHPLGLPRLLRLLLAQPLVLTRPLLVLMTRRLLFLRAPFYGLSMLLCGLGVLGARLLSLLLCLLLFRVLLLSGLRSPFLPLLLCLSVVLSLLLLVLLFAFLFALSLVLLVGRPTHHRNAGDGERTDDKDRALESLRAHASPLGCPEERAGGRMLLSTRDGLRPGDGPSVSNPQQGDRPPGQMSKVRAMGREKRP
ncbi:MAG TPA: hypothetical protein VEQ84_05335 [Vicinamibacteria bacterium]|nr:hypothetical protein [Vicinamibacteria bacterium]